MKTLSDLAKSGEESDSLGRHAVLLASLVGLLVALPVFQHIPGGGVRFSILLCIVLTAAVYVNSQRRWALIVTVLIAGGAIASMAMSEATGSMTARLASGFLSFALLASTTLLMLITLIRAERVSKDTIVGGICVYLMIGLCFTVLYSIVINLEPSALIQGGLPLAQAATDASARSVKLLYFSFVVLTTLGFGDITPSGDFAQMLVTAEAIIGQLYVAIFIARLIALYLSGDRAWLAELDSSGREEEK